MWYELGIAKEHHIWVLLFYRKITYFQVISGQFHAD